MKYVVLKAFNDITGFKKPGDTIELDDNRASKLRKNGLIGAVKVKEAEKVEKVEKAVREVEKVVKNEPIETRKPEKKVK